MFSCWSKKTIDLYIDLNLRILRTNVDCAVSSCRFDCTKDYWIIKKESKFVSSKNKNWITA